MCIVVAMTGTTGAAYGAHLLAAFRKLEARTWLVLSRLVSPTKSQGLLLARTQPSRRECRHSTAIQNPPMTSWIMQSVGRMPNLFGPELPSLNRWNGSRQPNEWSVDQL